LPGQRRVRLEEAAESANGLCLRFRVLDGKGCLSRRRRAFLGKQERSQGSRTQAPRTGKDLWITVRIARALATKRTKVDCRARASDQEGKYVFPLTSPNARDFPGNAVSRRRKHANVVLVGLAMTAVTTAARAQTNGPFLSVVTSPEEVVRLALPA